MQYKALTIAALLAFANNTWAASIDVVVPSNPVNVGDVFTASLVADLQTPVLGWGADVQFDRTVLELEAVTVSAPWSGAASRDGDGLVGLIFPDPLAGNDVPLATLRFRALAAGDSTIVASTTAGDATEGFPLPAPAAPGFFDTVQATPGTVTVAAQPAQPGPSTPPSTSPPAANPPASNPPSSTVGTANTPPADSGGGGATGLLSLLALLGFAIRRRIVG